MNVATWLTQTALSGADRSAVFLGKDCVLTYGAFDRAARSLGAWLQAQGVAPGDRVAIFLPNCPDYLVALFGIWAAGAAAVPINAKLHPREVAFILQDAGASHVFVTGAHVAGLHEAGATAAMIDVAGPTFAAAKTEEPLAAVTPRAPTDMAWLFYTSGTTGQPKGVVITHRMLTVVSLSYPMDVDPVRGEDATLYAAPLSHGAGLYALVHVRAGTGHICPVSGGFDPAEIFDLAAYFGSVHMFAAPTMVKRMTDVAQARDTDGPGLRTVVYAGGPMYEADILAAGAQFGPKFVQIYGQGECPMGITALSRDDVADRTGPAWRARLGSVGRAQSAVEVRVADTDGKTLPPGAQGEILVRGDAVMPGYWNNPDATAKTLKDGWLYTGDVGVLDAAGYLTLQDRSKDVIITGGSNVYPREVEEVLLAHPGVEEVSVVGRPHPDWGEEVVAFVVGEAAPADLDQLCLARIARFKRPKTYLTVDALPKNNYGKVLKTKLRARLAHT